MAKAPAASDSTVLLDGESLGPLANSRDFSGIEDEPSEVALDNVLNALESDQIEAKVIIWKSDPLHSGKGKVRDTYLTELSPSDFQDYGLAGIKYDYGEGSFRVKIHASDGRLLLNRVFNIGAPTLKEKLDFEQKRKEELAQIQIPQNQNSGGADGFIMLAKVMQEGFNGMARIISDQQNNRKGMLEELMLYKNLFSPANGAGNNAQVTDPFGMMKSALELVKELGAGKTGETSMIDGFTNLAEKFMPAITEIVKAKSNQPVQMPATLTAAPSISLAPPVSNPGAAAIFPEQTRQPEEQDQMSLLLRMYVPMLVQQARAGNDPFKYADMILDNVDANFAKQFAQRPDWLEYLAAFDPAIREPAIAQWFERLRAMLLEILTAEEKEDTTGGTDGISTDSLQ
jgi:hypothetical protein